MVLEKDGEWGIATIRQRLLKRLTAFIEISEKTRSLTGLRDVSLSLRETLETRWKPDLADLPLYRAFVSPPNEETPATAS